MRFLKHVDLQFDVFLALDKGPPGYLAKASQQCASGAFALGRKLQSTAQEDHVGRQLPEQDFCPCLVGTCAHQNVIIFMYFLIWCLIKHIQKSFGSFIGSFSHMGKGFQYFSVNIEKIQKDTLNIYKSINIYKHLSKTLERRLSGSPVGDS